MHGRGARRDEPAGRPDPIALAPGSPDRVSAALFSALGDPTRLALVLRLCDDGPSSIARLTARGNITRQAVTKHLRVLELAGIVTASRSGRETAWRIEQARLAEAQRHLDRIATRWDQALARLRALVEAG